MRHSHQFDRAHEVIVQSPAPVGRLPLGGLAIVGAISVAFWVSLAHGLALL